MTRMRRRVAARAGVAVAIGLLVGVTTQPMASAHATFVSMSPADGAVVATAPPAVVVTFNEPIQDIGTVVAVRAPSGASVTDGDPVVVDNTVTAKLLPLTERGTYAVAFRVTSTDGHPVARQLSFSLDQKSVVSSSAPSPGRPPSPGMNAGLLVLAVAVLVAIAVGLLVRRDRRRGRTDQPAELPGEDTW